MSLKANEEIIIISFVSLLDLLLLQSKNKYYA